MFCEATEIEIYLINSDYPWIDGWLEHTKRSRQGASDMRMARNGL